MKKLAILAILGALVPVSQAASIAFSTVGLYAQSSAGFSASNNSVVYQLHPGYNDVNVFNTTVSGVDLTTATISTGTGTASYSNGSLSEVLNVNLAVTSIVKDGAARSLAGTWTYTSGVGTYNAQKGSGTWAATLNPTLGQLDLTTFTGSLQAVPEPASMAVIGIGAMALAARRRRK